MKLSERERGGRPRKPTAPRTRFTSVAVAGEVPVVYANVISVTKGHREALIRFGLSFPGDGARAVADVLVALGVLAELAT